MLVGLPEMPLKHDIFRLPNVFAFPNFFGS